MNERLTFGERVRELRKDKHLSQNALAKKAGVSPRTIFGYEAGTTYPRTENMLNRLADALGVTSEALVDGTSSLDSFAFIRADHTHETQARMLTQQAVSFMSGDYLSDAQKDAMAQAIMDAYWESRRKSREKNDTTT
ncbi:MAG: helix-turn-helix transcriptional regulator [Clostridia bacterium]|nr:helix-turn-helix transcriptional regulator [Clostridia bacterium]